ncbi:MAG: type II toxin-antitoxin system prevent-host-death family antitoxin [Chloroflexi bacterium]|nr:type II toxin-antitoxin system prevent-host-death family antitoxin [Chloroflexota bacterium]
MASVTIRELRVRGGAVVDRVAASERVTITRSGKPVAELRPLPGEALTAPLLLERWRRLPRLDPVARGATSSFSTLRCEPGGKRTERPHGPRRIIGRRRIPS